jgi:hypothetical protein
MSGVRVSHRPPFHPIKFIAIPIAHVSLGFDVQLDLPIYTSSAACTKYGQQQHFALSQALVLLQQ